MLRRADAGVSVKFPLGYQAERPCRMLAFGTIKLVRCGSFLSCVKCCMWL